LPFERGGGTGGERGDGRLGGIAGRLGLRPGEEGVAAADQDDRARCGALHDAGGQPGVGAERGQRGDAGDDLGGGGGGDAGVGVVGEDALTGGGVDDDRADPAAQRLVTQRIREPAGQSTLGRERSVSWPRRQAGQHWSRGDHGDFGRRGLGRWRLLRQRAQGEIVVNRIEAGDDGHDLQQGERGQHHPPLVPYHVVLTSHPGVRLRDINARPVFPGGASGGTAVEFDVVVEIPKGQRNKYEVDHESGKIRLDRLLFTSTQYPADYG